MHEVRSRRIAALGCLLAAGLVLAACGGSSHSASASTTPSSGATSTTTAGGANGRGAAAQAALTAFRTCMSSHGVTVTLPTGGRNRGAGGTPPSTTPGETRPARPNGGAGFGGGGGGFANRFATAPAGVDKTKYAAAYTVCKAKLPTFSGLGGGAGGANNSAFQAYRSCLSDHGVTLPTSGGAGNINRNDPKVVAAMKTCAPLLPAGGFGRSTTTTTQPA